MGQIATIYEILMDIVQTHMGVYTKADSANFEQIPAVGFGIATIESIGVLGQHSIKDVQIPVYLVDAGSHPLVSVSLTEMYEGWEDVFKANIEAHLGSAGIVWDAIEFGDYHPMPIGQDDSQRGLEGTITFRIKI